ncbi:hypothetical protein JFL43_04935 [Viridibacillus sp. YIM B01967]|uniref:Tetratricopeptide repeat protein n=1 Tax=Viridibacillus soli TaxID=2798301 RepID=A0ABS1H461_9BACL|nr:tetratricopeptide repeat protein [Viridibacillus soli]MBK3494210.1 hypothetical protein [Viridibacillus soli]
MSNNKILFTQEEQNTHKNNKNKDVSTQIAHDILTQKRSVPSRSNYVDVAKLLKRENKVNQATKLLQEGANIHSMSLSIHAELMKIYIRKKNLKAIAMHLPRTVKNIPRRKESTLYYKLYKYLVCKRHYVEADEILQLVIKKDPTNEMLRFEFTQLALAEKNWPKAIQRIEELVQFLGEEVPASVLVDLSIAYQIVGDHSKAELLFAECLTKYKEEIPNLFDNGYRKVVLFDNGESRIEFYKYIEPTKTVFATFDAIDKTWERTPFAFNLLKRKQVDLISLRRRTTKNYHQDLSREEYYDTVAKLATGYDKKFSYGTSLGGYGALYFGSTIDCNILALSPRNSAHPNHGSKMRAYTEFTHGLEHPYNPGISPTIMYDPKDPIDSKYMKKVIQKAYPNAKFIYFPYAGHRISIYLSQVGILKDIVSKFMAEEEIPNYERVLRSKSTEYHRILAIHCARTKKKNWALQLTEQSIQLSPTYDRPRLLKVELLRDLNRIDEAFEAAYAGLELFPRYTRMHLLLISLLEQQDRLPEAIEAVDHALQSSKSAKLKEKREELLAKAETLATI